MAHPLVYEINTRCWLRELSVRHKEAVTLANIPKEEFQQWRELGFSHIWLMGVWTSGRRVRNAALTFAQTWRDDDKPPVFRDEDIAGSPYAISGYHVSDELGGELALSKFRDLLHAHGLKLLLDFIPNHLGLDHPLIARRPELFVSSAREVPGTFSIETRSGARWLAHGKDPFFPPWLDTVQLDYRQPETHAAMQEALLSVAARCDGVRCDMAMLVLNNVFQRNWSQFPFLNDATKNSVSEFWSDAIPATKRIHPEFLFLAEVYWGLEERLQALGFDYTYDKVLYDDVVARNSAGVQERLQRSTPQFVAASAHFLENHDERRIASLLSIAEHRAAALLILALPGMRLLHEGQLSGARIRIPVQLLTRPGDDSDPAIARMYEELLLVLKRSSVGRGECRLLQSVSVDSGNATNQNIVLVQWEVERNGFEVAAVNLANAPSQCYATLQVENFAAKSWAIEDLLQSGENAVRVEILGSGVRVDLPSHAASLLRFRMTG
jgi:hypothetical protein